MLLGITCIHCCKCMHKRKMHNQQGPTIEQMELRSMLCGTLDGRGVWGRIDSCIWRAESLPCPSETIMLLISYTPIQNKTLTYIYTHYNVKNLIVFYRKTNKDNNLPGGKSFYHYEFQMQVLYMNSIRNTFKPYSAT